MCPWRRLVHSGAPWLLSGSFGVVGFIQVRPGCRRIHSWALGSFCCTLGVVAFIGGRWVQSATLDLFVCALVVVGFIRGRSIHSGAQWVSLRLFGDVGFIQVRPGGHWVIQVSAGGCRVHSGSLGSFRCTLGIVGFIWGRWVQLGTPFELSGTLGSSLGVVVFIRGRWVLSSVLWGSMGSF